MTDVRILRQKNFQQIVKSVGLAKVMEITGRQRSQIADCAAGRRTIGEKLARGLESELGLELGSLDLPELNGDGLSVAPVGQRRVPLLPWTQVASGGDNEPTDVLLTSMKVSTNAFAIEIRDQSMSPAFAAGDRVIIDPEIAPVPGDFVVAIVCGEAVFRKFRKQTQNEFGLVPLNPDFPTLSGNEVEKIVGVMVEHRIYRKP